MLTTVIIVVLALALFGYVSLPLIAPRGADPLPAERDPVTSDLEEEKAALFRAIRELDAREDLPTARREQLRARYEAKTARVLRALDEQKSAPSTPGATRRRSSRRPYGALALLGATAVIATTLSTYVLPRVGENASLTSFFREDLDAARGLRDLQRAVERNPNGENLLALADGYWRLDDAEGARETYLRAVEEAGVDSALAYRRLGFLTLQTDLDQAGAYLERSRALDPGDLDTLYTLGEIAFAQGQLEGAADHWRAFLEAPGGEGDEQVNARLRLAEELAPLAQRVEANPNQDNLMALAGALWRHDERARAVEVYFRVLTQHDPNDTLALGRTGQLMFMSGRNEDAIALMERASSSDDVDAETLLFLGNAYFSEERYAEAITVWERHVSLVGKENAGRVPALIADARERQAGNEPSATSPAAAGGATGELGPDVFAANCASCHGPSGGGGAGPRLAGNPRAANANNVRDAVSFGRGMMPGFASLLNEEEIEAVVEYVSVSLNSAGEVR